MGGEQLLEIFLPMLAKFWEHAKPVEFAQSLGTAAIIWHMVRKAMEEELKKIRLAISSGFSSGDKRFGAIDTRLDLHDLRFEKIEIKLNK